MRIVFNNPDMSKRQNIYARSYGFSFEKLHQIPCQFKTVVSIPEKVKKTAIISRFQWQNKTKPDKVFFEVHHTTQYHLHTYFPIHCRTNLNEWQIFLKYSPTVIYRFALRIDQIQKCYLLNLLHHIRNYSHISLTGLSKNIIISYHKIIIFKVTKFDEIYIYEITPFMSTVAPWDFSSTRFRRCRLQDKMAVQRRRYRLGTATLIVTAQVVVVTVVLPSQCTICIYCR